MKKRQLNGNVREDVVPAVKEIASRTGLSIGQIMEASLAYSLGSKNKMIVGTVEMAQKAYSESEAKLPFFEFPLTPSENNALTRLAA